MNRHLIADEFEDHRHGGDGGSWSYDDSPYEQATYAATLEACGPGPFVCALELGGSIGVFTEMLAPRCEALTTIDVSRTAAAMAKRRLADVPDVRMLRGPIPDTIPEEAYDLVVASEILYHLGAEDLERTLAVIRARLVPGGRLVAVHWRPAEPERLVSDARVHARLRDDPWLVRVHGERTPTYLLDVLERR